MERPVITYITSSGDRGVFCSKPGSQAEVEGQLQALIEVGDLPRVLTAEQTESLRVDTVPCYENGQLESLYVDL